MDLRKPSYTPSLHPGSTLGAGGDDVQSRALHRESLLRADLCSVYPWGLPGAGGGEEEVNRWAPSTKLTPCLLSHSWAFGSNSLPIAGSVGMGVARRTQRQFPMPPRALPPGRMGLLSPSGIGGISPRHALTSPSLGGQGRQVSQLEAKDLALLGLGGWCLRYVSISLCLGPA